MLYKFNFQLSFKADRWNEIMYTATVKHDVNTTSWYQLLKSKAC